MRALRSTKTVVLSMAAGLASALHAQTVIEYVNQADFPRSPLGQFFYSASPSEQAFVDGGGAGQFKRTGNSFIAGGATPLCRFYGSVTPGPNSHFYTINPQECASLQAAQITPRPTTIQQWNYEGNGFSAIAPAVNASGQNSCAVGTKAVYRAYNNAFTSSGAKNPWDSNHRYSTRRGDIDYLVKVRGWSDEGIVYCVSAEGPEPTYAPERALMDKCIAPRSDPKYGDRAGTVDEGKDWVRSYVDERYLWYDEVPRLHPSIFSTPQQYFEALRTREKTASGKDKDEFHFIIPTPQWEAFESGDAGVVYGITFVPAELGKRPYPMITLVEPSSPAGLAGVKRGMEMRSVNGVSLENNTNINAIGSLVGATAAGQTKQFVFVQPSTGQRLEVSLAAARVTTTAVQSVKVLNRPDGAVGYFLYNDFITSSESQLIAATNQLLAAGVKDLVLDLRYNSGGLVYLASQLGYMIAGSATRDKTFQKYLFNRKRVADNNDPDNVLPFFDVASGFQGSGTVANVPLPTLDLRRLYVLTSGDTASASEAVINSLRGIDVDVVLIGTTTTGKPFGFYPEENCGTTYLTVEFQGVNAKGFGEFADGFAPTCTVVDDDFTRDFGDPLETRLAAALAYRETGACPAASVSADTAKASRLLLRTGAESKLPLMIGMPRTQRQALREAMDSPRSK